jgi:hypothetical protein
VAGRASCGPCRPQASSDAWKPEPVIYREEVLGLLFGVADISDTLDKLYKLLGGEDVEEEDDAF